jgi:four helix bundle protein
MPKYEKFEDLPVWQDAARLYNQVLDLLETPRCPLSSGFRYQVDRAALSVSNNIAEAFERTTTGELLQFLGFARGSAGEVRSMVTVVATRPKLRPLVEQLHGIRHSAESCARQLQAWRGSIEGGRVQGNRYLSAEMKQRRLAAEKAAEFRRNFLRGLKPEHPLHKSREARAARGEPLDDQ